MIHSIKSLRALIFILSLFFAAACAHNPNKAEKLDTKMEKSTGVGGEDVGIKDGNMVIQKKSELSEEWRRLKNEVYGLEDHVYGNETFNSRGLYGVLKDCRKDITARENGGDGKLMWTEPLERLTDREEDAKLGVDENGKLVAVSEEFTRDRIERFKEYKRILLKREEEYQDKVDVCQAELRSRKEDKQTAQKEP